MIEFKKLTCLLVMLIVGFVFAQQSDSSIVGLKAGVVQNGFGLSVEYDYFISDKQYISGELLGTHAEFELTEQKIKTPYNSLYLNVGYNFKLFSNYAESLALSSGLGLSGGYQLINNGEKQLESGALIQSESKAVLGGFLTLDLKAFLNERLLGSISYKQFYHPESETGKAFPFFALGLHYKLF